MACGVVEADWFFEDGFVGAGAVVFTDADCVAGAGDAVAAWVRVVWERRVHRIIARTMTTAATAMIRQGISGRRSLRYLLRGGRTSSARGSWSSGSSSSWVGGCIFNAGLR